MRCRQCKFFTCMKCKQMKIYSQATFCWIILFRYEFILIGIKNKVFWGLKMLMLILPTAYYSVSEL